MSVLSPAELASLRALNEGSMPDTATVFRPAPVESGPGEYTDRPVAVATYPARSGAAVRYQQEVPGAGGIVEVPRWPVSLPWDADVRRTDTVRVEGDGYVRYLEVVNIAGPATYSTSLKIEGVEVEPWPE